ncbi:MAG: prolipoprotein diacylglyceryl transferase [Gemmataceae bacterium]|nr:prolipoprotein diacylglyceryl transferase [Gemmataceae bacterium]
MADLGPFTLTWHGFFTAVGIVAGVSLAVWLCKRDGVPTEIGQEIALVAVPSAIVGARLLFVVEHWDKYSEDIPKIVTGITEGGITLYGGLIGGVLGGLVYALFRKWPIAIVLDAAAPGMILGQAIGRLGDLINGEHHATMSDLPWAVRYINPNTLGQAFDSRGNPAYFHPTAGGYELLGDVVILALLLFVARRFIKVPGWTFCSYVILYGVMRFFLSYFRIDEQELYGVPVPQVMSAAFLGVAVIAAGVLMRHPGPITEEYAERVWGEDRSEPPKKSGQAAHA